MSVTLKLDRPAVAALIENDPEFKFELSHAVTNEVIRKFFDKNMSRLIREADRELFDRAVQAMQEDSDMAERIKRALDQQLVVRPGYSIMPKMSPVLEQMFKDAVVRAQQQIEDAANAVVGKIVSERAAALVEQKLKDVDIDARIANRVDRMLNEEIEKRVREHHDRLLAKMKEALQ